MKYTLSGTVFTFLALATMARAQIDTTSGPTDTYIDNIVDSTLAEPERVEPRPTRLTTAPFVQPSDFRALEKKFVPSLESGKEQPILLPPKPFWKTKKISQSYGYTEEDSNLADAAETEVNIGKTELYLESWTKFALTTAFTFQDSSKTDILGDGSDTNSYGFTVQPAQEVFYFINRDTRRRDQLFAAFGFGYTRSDSDFFGPAGDSTGEANAWSISPNLAYLYPSRDEKWTFILSPTYTMQWKETSRAGATTNTNAGRFSFLARADRKLGKRWIGSLGATWKHDVNQKVAPGKTAVFHDWAEFGISLRYEVNKTLRVKASYNYEAFHSDFDAHKLAATGEFSF